MPVFCRHVMPRSTTHKLIAINLLIFAARMAEIHIRVQQRRRNDRIIRKMVAVQKEADAAMGKKDEE
jgi:hypothetical protein